MTQSNNDLIAKYDTQIKLYNQLQQEKQLLESSNQATLTNNNSSQAELNALQ